MVERAADMADPAQTMIGDQMRVNHGGTGDVIDADADSLRQVREAPDEHDRNRRVNHSG